MDEKSGIGFVNASTRNLERKIHGGARSSRKKTVPIDQQTVGRSDRRERERGKFEKRQRDKARGNSSDRSIDTILHLERIFEISLAQC